MSVDQAKNARGLEVMLDFAAMGAVQSDTMEKMCDGYYKTYGQTREREDADATVDRGDDTGEDTGEDDDDTDDPSKGLVSPMSSGSDTRSTFDRSIQLSRTLAARPVRSQTCGPGEFGR